MAGGRYSDVETESSVEWRTSTKLHESIDDCRVSLSKMEAYVAMSPICTIIDTASVTASQGLAHADNIMLSSQTELPKYNNMFNGSIDAKIKH